MKSVIVACIGMFGPMDTPELLEKMRLRFPDLMLTELHLQCLELEKMNILQHARQLDNTFMWRIA